MGYEVSNEGVLDLISVQLTQAQEKASLVDQTINNLKTQNRHCQADILRLDEQILLNNRMMDALAPYSKQLKAMIADLEEKKEIAP